MFISFFDMKKELWLLCFLLLPLAVVAQIVNIPNANFKAMLLNVQVPSQYGNYAKDLNGNEIIIDSNHDGEIQVSEALLVDKLGISMNNITTLQGIEAFVNLRYIEMFIVGGLQNLDELNTLTNLRSIHVATCGDIVSLDFSPLVNLTYVDINSLTLLHSLFLKNGKNETVMIGYCAALQYVCADESQITDVLTHVPAACVVNSYCSFTPGGTFYTIQGTDTFDGNSNGCDASDTHFPNIKYQLSSGTVSTTIFGLGSGNFSVPVQQGTHTVTPVLENQNYFTVSPSSASVTFPATASPATRNFCITPNGIHHDVEAQIIPITAARPGFDALYKIIYRNKGNQIESGTISFAFNDAALDLISTNPPINSQVINYLNWNFTDLQLFETRSILVRLNLNSPLETPPVNSGSILDFTLSVNTTQTDDVPQDNIFVLHQTVINSLDPNDKTCLEGNTIALDKVGDYVHYLIRFENTGTAAAQNIVVKDIIDATVFDVSSLVPTTGSHPFFTKISNGNQVEFIFENIQLPFDDANNDGYVAFKIKTKPNLVLGNTFSNSANIYFDYNAPIITNTATTTVSNALANPTFEVDAWVGLAPNPVQDVFEIRINENIQLQSWKIYNTLGQLLMSDDSAQKSMDVSALNTGTYLIKISSDAGTITKTFIKR